MPQRTESARDIRLSKSKAVEYPWLAASASEDA